MEVIHRHYPENSKDLYNKIAESSLFVSIDPLTSLIHESTLIGTPVYVYDSCFKEFYDNFDFKLHGLYYNLKPSDLEKIYEDSKTLSSKYSWMFFEDARTSYRCWKLTLAFNTNLVRILNSMFEDLLL